MTTTQFRTINSWIEENLKLLPTRYEVWSIYNNRNTPWVVADGTCKTLEGAKVRLSEVTSHYPSERFEIREVYE